MIKDIFKTIGEIIVALIAFVGYLLLLMGLLAVYLIVPVLIIALGVFIGINIF